MSKAEGAERSGGLNRQNKCRAGYGPPFRGTINAQSFSLGPIVFRQVREALKSGERLLS